MASAAILSLLLWATHNRPLPEGKIRILDLINIGSFYMSNSRLEDNQRGLYYYWRAWELSRSLNPVDQRPLLTRRALWDYYYWQASGLDKKEDFSGAIDFYQKALFFDFDKADVRSRLAQLLFDEHKARPAFFEALRSADIDPELSKPHILLAIVYNHTLNRPLKSLYHLHSAWELAEEKDKPSFRRQIKSYLDRLAILGMIDETVSLENPESIRKLALKEISTPEVVKDRRLPKAVLEGSREQAENYMISLFENLLINPKSNKGAIYSQLAEIHGRHFDDATAEYFYMKRAWSNGLRYEGFDQKMEEARKRWAKAKIPWQKDDQPLGL